MVAESLWRELTGKTVVIDLQSPFVCLGKVVDSHSGFVLLEEVDLHDLRDTSSTRERYVVESRMHGIRANRRRAWISLREVIGVSLLEDVVEE